MTICQMARTLGGDDYSGLDRSKNTLSYPASKYINIRDMSASESNGLVSSK